MLMPLPLPAPDPTPGLPPRPRPRPPVDPLTSAACRKIPDADYVHLTRVRIPPERAATVPHDPAVLAARIFDITALGGPVRALFRIRQRLVTLIGIAPAPREVFAVREVRDGEALIAVQDSHLDFCAAVRREPDAVRLVTTVRLKGWRGRVYFLPVRLAHPLIVRAMVRRAVHAVHAVHEGAGTPSGARRADRTAPTPGG